MRADRRRARLERKIAGVEEIRRELLRLKGSGKKSVFTNGCFDILHYGHVKYLQDARSSGDVLVVGVNSDDSVRRIKGKSRPLNSEKDRARVLAALESVDFVVVFSEDNPLRLIRSLRPDILVKGADWSAKDIIGADFVKGYAGKVRRIKFQKGYSTSRLIDKIVKNSKK